MHLIPTNQKLKTLSNQNFKNKLDGMATSVYIKEYKQTETGRGVEKITYNASVQKINSRILAVEGADIRNTCE